MKMNDMLIADPETRLVVNEGEILDQLLQLQDATVLELGCGKAEKTRIVAKQAASVLALEVDEIQLAKNLAVTDLPNVRFAHGGAEEIPAPDANFDIVLMFKSLHHVPTGLMDRAFAEIRRVLKPGGVAYISEPVYAGEFNEVLKLFHDEQAVREAAFAAEKRAVASGQLALAGQKFFMQPMHFSDFAQFEEQVLKVTHTEHKLSDETYQKVHSRFNGYMAADGATFHMPIRVDLLKKQ
ncbi:MAG: class I SAM-dependent methyltransferase [Gallionella sp.]|nr:class I SAM-dependent methyltransferase [Gallionella sp.]